VGTYEDARTWTQTDRPGESMAVGQPVDGVEILSARGSTRHWSEPMHNTFTIAAVHRSAERVGAEWRTRGKTVTTAGGQLMTINPGDGHHTLRVYAPSAFDVIKLDPEWINATAQAGGLRSEFRFAAPSWKSDAASNALGQVVAAFAEAATRFELEVTCQELATVIVGHLGETRSPMRAQRPPLLRLRRVRDRLVDDVEERPSLAALEREAGLGKSQLCASFKDTYGLSIIQYWAGCRVARAKKALLQGMNGADVAAELGFTDESHFSRVFRKHTGLPPRRWVSIYRSNSHS
jgi:AraC-like DNA-binding protein